MRDLSYEEVLTEAVAAWEREHGHDHGPCPPGCPVWFKAEQLAEDSRNFPDVPDKLPAYVRPVVDREHLLARDETLARAYGGH